MKTEEQLTIRLRELEADERLYYKTATIIENAPLALHQLAGEVESRTLRWVLGMPVKKFSQERPNQDL